MNPALCGEWGNPPDAVYRCATCQTEHTGIYAEDEPCRHDNCRACRDESECCVECSVCHLLTDEYEVDEGVDPRCVDCCVKADEARRERRATMDSEAERCV